MDSTCLPVNLDFVNYSSNGNYTWLVDGEEVSNADSLNFTFDEDGLHEVALVVQDENSCNGVDTSRVFVDIPKIELQADWSVEVVNPCEDSLVVEGQFIGAGADSLYWEIDTQIIQDTSFQKTYSQSGTFPISMTAIEHDCGTSIQLDTLFFFNPLLPDWQVELGDSCGEQMLVEVDFVGQGADQYSIELAEEEELNAPLDIILSEAVSYTHLTLPTIYSV